ncbi:aminomethyl-transferring glycine dehydrogenase subunit GcvPA [Candidatus Bathyarchaeota archaeon]|nr:aminomethyl-transferring glycine dehydrogenase subunit GcvPA [Candidatus Bathyarchaeota archaeon]
MVRKRFVHPYIPNSVPEVKEEMLKEIGVKDAEELYAQMIPEKLRLRKPMKLPKPLPSEHDLKRHVEKILSKNKTCKDYLNFSGAGCWQHYVPAVCDEIARRSEFLTAYSGENYSDLGKFQAFFEFQSMMGELVGMDVVGVTTYDWGASAGNALRMASRITGRKEVLVPKIISPNRLSIIWNFCQPAIMPGHIEVKLVNYDPETGMLDLEDLKSKISSETAGVYFENPSYLGIVEAQGEEISEMAHENGAESIVGVDPISLGVLAPPAEYGADIVCGEAQPLGVHMYCGGGLCGFIGSRDEEKYVGEFPSLLISITSTEREGEYAFGHCRYDRTSYVARDKAKDWVGTATALWGIVAAVYMALMGPEGMKDVGVAIVQKSHYAAKLLSEIDGVKIPFSSFFKEFVVNFDDADKTVAEINKALLKHGIFGGKDITREFPELGHSALYCVTEIHTKEDLRKLADVLGEVVK